MKKRSTAWMWYRDDSVKEGVLQFDGDSLRYKRIVATNNRLVAPEAMPSIHPYLRNEWSIHPYLRKE